MCQENDVRLEKLTPYSPDFNLIEESFAELKMWIKKNRTFVEECERFEEFLRLELTYMSNKTDNHFRRAHIVNYS